ncbi:MAG: hypothetical protein RIR62_2295 [Pseudomonadota bacterium]
MNWDMIAGRWKEMMGAARAKWGEITDDEWTEIAGRRDHMVGTIQRRYGMARDEAERAVDDWSRGL